MNIIPWKSRETGLDVFQDIEDIQRQMNRLFEFNLARPGRTGVGGAILTPAVDIIDEKENIKVCADLPGMNKDEIEVTVENNVLTIKGEKKEERETKEKGYVRSERYYGAFHRSFTLPSGVDTNKVNANYKEGVLEITLPKREDAKTRQIKVDVK